ncbi:MAG: DUF4224 domain-containing protein [Chloroflexota bacterium]
MQPGPFILSPEELVNLTGRRRFSSQVRALRYMGIEHRVRPDRSLAVLRSHVEQAMGAPMYSSDNRRFEPDWSALNA